MLCVGPRREIGAVLTDKLERQRRADSMNLRQVDTQHAIKRGTDLEISCVHLPGFVPDFGNVADIVPVSDLKRLKRHLQLPITFEDFGLVEVVQRQGLAEREDVLVPPVP